MALDVLEQKIQQVVSLFHVIDDDMRGFCLASGLSCLKECRHCCDNPLIETTELELLPLAKAMVEAGTAEEAYIEAEQRKFSGYCIFFEPELTPGSKGHCRMYGYRPVLCRIFGFFGNKDKYGQVKLAVCTPLKESCSAKVSQVSGDVSVGKIQPPQMAQYSMRAMAIDTALQREVFPINMAFKRAVDRVWIYRRYAGQTGISQES